MRRPRGPAATAALAAALMAASAGVGYLGAAALDGPGPGAGRSAGEMADRPAGTARTLPRAPAPAPRTLSAPPDPAPPPETAPRTQPAPAAPEEPPAAPEKPPATPPPRHRDEVALAPEPAPPEPAPPAKLTVREPSPPPGTVRIPPGAAPSGSDAARRILAGRLADAAPGSRTASDLRHTLRLARRFLDPGAEVPAGRRSTIARTVRDAAWWYAGHRAPPRRVLLRDADGIILTYRPGQGFAVNPVATTGRWRGLNAGLPPERLAEPFLEMGVERSVPGRRFLVWEYYDVADDPGAIAPGASAMAQARVALLMAHAFRRTGDRRFAAAGRAALAAFTVSVDRGGVRSDVRGPADPSTSPWYVERAYPGADPWKGGALNGFMVALLNLRGAASAFEGSPPTQSTARLARSLADRGAESLVRFLPLHDSGTWSRYGLVTPGRAPGGYLADRSYHCYHVRLLRRLAAIYPRATFAETADRWQGYAAAAGVGCEVPRA
jgi:hypothetical protein